MHLKNLQIKFRKKPTMKKYDKKNSEVKDKSFGGKPAFGEIFNIKGIAVLIIVLVLIVLSLIFILGLF